MRVWTSAFAAIAISKINSNVMHMNDEINSGFQVREGPIQIIDYAIFLVRHNGNLWNSRILRLLLFDLGPPFTPL
jgi:hypothetical protein